MANPTKSPSIHSSHISIQVDTDDHSQAPSAEAFLLVKRNPKPPPPGPSAGNPRSPFTLNPAPGTTIAGKYQLESIIGRGGMGTIWAARHIELDSPVAIKLMSPTYASSQRERSRFKREARAAAQLRSRHVVAVLDYGIDLETPYIVMEKLEGEDLCSRLHRYGPMSVQLTASLLNSVSSALTLAHEKGIIHRDLKPENIFLARMDGEADDIVKVLDFGLSKELRPSFDYDRTSTGVAMGTPAYMSPEQIEDSGTVDHRADLWSLAVILFRLLTGHLPFSALEAMKLIIAVLEDPIPLPSLFAPHLSPDVDRFFERALRRNPDHRFQSAHEMNATFQEMALRCTTDTGLPNGADTLPVELSSADFVAIDISEVRHWTADTK